MPKIAPLVPEEATIVVLRFVEGMVVDLVPELAGEAAIGAVFERAIRAGRKMPLLEAASSPVPPEALDRLRGLAAAPPAVAAPPPTIPVAGAVQAIAAYVRATTAATSASVYSARGALADFFGRYGARVDFAGEPEGKEDTDQQPPRKNAKG